jgi:hypothetical protein
MSMSMSGPDEARQAPLVMTDSGQFDWFFRAFCSCQPACCLLSHSCFVALNPSPLTEPAS